MSKLPFNIGDKVIVNPNTQGIFPITIPGSIGTIINITNFSLNYDIYCIKFENIKYKYDLGTFNFSSITIKRYFSLYNTFILSKHDKKYEKVILKIKQLENKRKELGYAY